jgi:hypothetical protein
MRTKELIKFTASILDAKVGTVADHLINLQTAGLVLKGTPGRFGGHDMTETCGVSTILACALDRTRGESAAAMVARIRALRMVDAQFNPFSGLSTEDRIRGAFEFAQGLSIRPLATLGDTLDGLVRDMRSGAFEVWADRAAPQMVLEITDGRIAGLIIDRYQTNSSGVFQFDDGTPTVLACVGRVVRIRRPAFQALANALGPLTGEVLPPY